MVEVSQAMTREETRQKLIEMLEPLIENEGFELIYLQYVAGRNGRLLITVDHERGISVEDCARISRAVSELLDYEDPIRGSYTLEVSSPGPERPLTKKAHFFRFEGEKVKIELAEELDGAKKFSGRLQAAQDHSIILELVDRSVVELPYRLIEKANLWYIKPEK